MDLTKHTWLFEKSEIVASTPSRQHDIPYEDELSMRRKSCKFAIDICNALGDRAGVMMDPALAAVLVHRFFMHRSFRNFDFRDVGACCLLIASQKQRNICVLDYFVPCWEALKFNNKGRFQDELEYSKKKDRLAQTRDEVFKCVGDVVAIELPHMIVHKYKLIIGQRCSDTGFMDVAHQIVLEVICITDWSIRYTNVMIATACVKIAAYFCDASINENIDSPWFKVINNTIKIETLDAMLDEFIDLFRNPSNRFGSLQTLDMNDKVKAVAPTRKAPKALPKMELNTSKEPEHNPKCAYKSYKAECLARSEELNQAASNFYKADEERMNITAKYIPYAHNSNSSVILNEHEKATEMSYNDSGLSKSSGSDQSKRSSREYKSISHLSDSPGSVGPSHKHSRTSNNDSRYSRRSHSNRYFARKSRSSRKKRSSSRFSSSSQDDEPTRSENSRRSTKDRNSFKNTHRRESSYKENNSKSSYYQRRH